VNHHNFKPILKFCIGFILIFCLFSSLIKAQQIELSKQDGDDWLSWHEIYKSGFIAGLILGASTVSHKAGFVYDLDEIKEFIDKVGKELQFIIYVEEKMRYFGIFNITGPQLKSGVDDFYKDFANRKIKIIDAVYISKMKIEGKDSLLIDAQIRYLRMRANPSFKKTSFEYFRKILDFIFLSKEKRRSSIKLSLQEGKISKEDFIKAGFFIDENGDMIPLFIFGDYIDRN